MSCIRGLSRFGQKRCCFFFFFFSHTERVTHENGYVKWEMPHRRMRGYKKMYRRDGRLTGEGARCGGRVQLSPRGGPPEKNQFAIPARGESFWPVRAASETETFAFSVASRGAATVFSLPLPCSFSLYLSLSLSVSLYLSSRYLSLRPLSLATSFLSFAGVCIFFTILSR